MKRKTNNKNNFHSSCSSMWDDSHPDDFLFNFFNKVKGGIVSSSHFTLNKIRKIHPKQWVFRRPEIFNMDSLFTDVNVNEYHMPERFTTKWKKKKIQQAIELAVYPWTIIKMFSLPFKFWKDMALAFSRRIINKRVEKKNRKLYNKYANDFLFLAEYSQRRKGIFERLMEWKKNHPITDFIFSPTPYATAAIAIALLPKMLSEFEGERNQVRNIASFLQGNKNVNINIMSEEGIDIGPLSIPANNIFSMQYNPNNPSLLHVNANKAIKIQGKAVNYLSNLKPAIFHKLGGYTYQMKEYEQSWLSSIDFDNMSCNKAPIVGTIASMFDSNKIVVNNKEGYSNSYDELSISYIPKGQSDKYYISDYHINNGKRNKQGVIECESKGDAQFTGLIAHMADNMDKRNENIMKEGSYALGF